MAQMPFSPCDAAAVADCQDTSFLMLKYVFGDMVSALAQGADPNSVAAATNVLAAMFGFFNSGLLIVGAILVTYITVVGVLNTANDGEAMGKDWSSVWTTARIVTGSTILLPTTSGFSFIQLFVMTVTLWGVGLANGVYRTGMATSIMTPEGLVAGALSPGQYYGLNDFARQYTESAYCMRSGNEIFAASDGIPGAQIKLDTASTRVESGFVQNDTSSPGLDSFRGVSQEITPIRDVNPASNLAGGKALCGEVRLNRYAAGPALNDTDKLINALQVKVQAIKLKATKTMMKDIDAWVATWPARLSDPGWDKVVSNKLNQIVQKADGTIAQEIAQDIQNNKAGVDQVMNSLLDEMLKKGWASAGGWYQKVGLMRQSIQKATSPSVGSGGGIDLSGLPDDERSALFVASVTDSNSMILEKANDQKTTPKTTEDIANLVPKKLEDINVTKINDSINSTMDSFMNRRMANIVTLATGKGGEGIPDALLAGCGLNGQMGGSLNRMKCVGDYIVSIDVALSAANFVIKTSVSAVRAAAALASSGKVLGTGLTLDGLGVVLKDFIYEGILEQISTVIGYLKVIGFYFSVVLPSLPYAIFIVVVVGWLLGVLQAMICAPMWALLLMTPSRSFIGSQTQGLFLFLTLFARPALAILGLFAAMLISDPIIDFVAQEFFSMRGAVVGDSGPVGWVAEFFSFANWMIVFGGVLGPVLYMTYGLPQALPDAALQWIGAGIPSLGATSAISEARNAGNTAMGSPGGGGKRLGNDNGAAALPGSAGPSGKPSGGTDGNGKPSGGKPEVITNDQGVPPAPASGEGGGGGSGGPRASSGREAGPGTNLSNQQGPASQPRTINGPIRPMQGSSRLGNALGTALGSAVRGNLRMSTVKNQFLYGEDSAPQVDNPNYVAPTESAGSGSSADEETYTHPKLERPTLL